MSSKADALKRRFQLHNKKIRLRKKRDPNEADKSLYENPNIVNQLDRDQHQNHNRSRINTATPITAPRERSNARTCSICGASVSIFLFDNHQRHCLRNAEREESDPNPKEQEQEQDINEQKELSERSDITSEATDNSTNHNLSGIFNNSLIAMDLKECKYCEYPCDDITKHEEECGSRTDLCTQCGRRDTIKDLICGTHQCPSQSVLPPFPRALCDGVSADSDYHLMESPDKNDEPNTVDNGSRANNQRNHSVINHHQNCNGNHNGNRSWIYEPNYDHDFDQNHNHNRNHNQNHYPLNHNQNQEGPQETEDEKKNNSNNWSINDQNDRNQSDDHSHSLCQGDSQCHQQTPHLIRLERERLRQTRAQNEQRDLEFAQNLQREFEEARARTERERRERQQIEEREQQQLIERQQREEHQRREEEWRTQLIAMQMRERVAAREIQLEEESVFNALDGMFGGDFESVMRADIVRRRNREQQENLDLSNLSYEELEQMFPNQAHGAREDTIRMLPVEIYKKRNDGNDEGNKCCICLEQFKEGDRLRRLQCMHIFHQTEIDDWLRRNRECPICRINVDEHR